MVNLFFSQSIKNMVTRQTKSGAITEVKPELTDTIPFGEFSKDRVLKYATSLERNSEHPLATAAIESAKTKQ